MARRGNSPAPSASKAALLEREEVDQEFDLAVHLHAHSPLIAIVAVLLALLVWFYTQLGCYYHNKQGHYCTDQTNPEQKWLSLACDAGYYCTGSYAAPVACPAGTTSANTSATSAATCVKCAVGTYSEKTAFTGACAACTAPAGSFCAEGSTSAAGSICPAGSTCEGGSAPAVAAPVGFYTTGNATLAKKVPCPSGTGSNVTGVASAQGCTACAPGTFQPSKGLNYCINSTPGYIVSGASAVAQAPCPEGTFQENSRSTACVSCSKGHYNARKGQATCNVAEAKGTEGDDFYAGYFVATVGASEATKCPKGTHALTSGQDHCDPIPVGYHSKFNAKGEYLGSTQCGAGFFGGVGSGATCQPCPRGTFSNTVGAVNIESCTKCAAGTFSVTENATDDSVCKKCGTGLHVPVGSYCPEGNDDQDGIPCPEKKYCAGADAQPQDIPADFYLLGGVTLTKCPDNFHLPTSSEGQDSWHDVSAHPCIPNVETQ